MGAATETDIQAIIELIGIPIDLGQTQRGVNLGPGALRYAGLRQRLQELGYQLIDRGDRRRFIR